MLNPGETAPDFELEAHTGEKVRLSSFRGRKAVVLFFYPKDDTAGCTKEACSFRDNYAEFVSQDTAVLGISSDSGESHQQFASKYNLPFSLLSDPGGRVRSAYGVGRTLGIIPGRATFVIDKVGVIRSAFSSQFQPEEHVRTALSVLQSA
jgi:peroxiredoxin Q/BCP